MTKLSIIETLRGHWPTLDRDIVALESDPTYTIRPPTVDTAGRRDRALAVLDRLAEVRSGAPGLTLQTPLGEGAMGVVHLAVQESLGRHVAVKSVKPNQRSEQAIVHLLQEAWVTGALEHPNVVPVYDMGVDAEGEPQLVLKRVEGTSWGVLVGDPDEVRRRFGTSDPMEWHLRTLMQVCTAVHFAHSRGIVHRDLKPENVMIGDYGEVYLADWGIAVCLASDPGGRLPSAAEATTMAGTPGYMAPEMVGTEPSQITPLTDVFLLGAVLYHIVVGYPPHVGANVFEMLSKVLAAEPKYPEEGVPDALLAICRRAMARAPSDRYPDAEAFRRDVQTFLERRASTLLSTQAEALERRLEALLATPDADRGEVYRLFGECRFGFRSALSSWPENPAARAGLVAVTTQMVELELDAGHPESAASALAELEDPPAALVERLAHARRAADEARVRLAELERMRADLDPSVARGTRIILATVMGSAFALAPLVRAVVLDDMTYAGIFTSLGVTIGLALLVAAVYGKTLRRTAFNRRIGETVFVTLLGLLLLDLGAMQLGVSAEHALVFHNLVAGVIASMVTVAIEPLMFPSVIGYTASFLVSVFVPSVVPFTMAAANLLMTANALWIWTQPEERRLRFRRRGES